MHSPPMYGPIDDSELVLLLVNNIKDYAIYALDPDGNVLTWNEGAKRLKQFTSEEIRGQHFSIFYTDEDKGINKPQTMLKLAKENGKSGEEGWRVRKDGSLFWASVVITALFDQDRNLRGYAKVTHDITARKLAAEREKLIYDIAVEAARSPSVKSLLQFVLERVGTYLGWPLGHVYLWNDTSKCLKSAKLWHLADHSDQYSHFQNVSEELTFISGIGLPGMALQRKEVVLVNGANAEKKFHRRAVLKDIDLHTALAIPLIDSEKVFAVLEFFSAEEVNEVEPIVELARILSVQISRFVEKKRSHDEQEFFFNASKDLLCFVGFDGYIKRANPSWIEALSYTPDEVKVIPWADFVHPDDLPLAIESGRNQVEHGVTVTTELRFRHKDGSYRLLQWHSVPVLDREMAYAIGRDVTEHRAIEKELEETLSLQNAILNGTSYGIVSVGMNGLVKTFNKGAEELFGYKAEEFVGVSNPPPLTDKDSWEMRCASLSERLGKKVEYGLDALIALANLDTHEEFEWDYVRKDGSKFPALLAVSSLRDENNQISGYMGIVQDISARRKAEAEKNRLLTILENSPDLICFGEPGGPILYQNKGGSKILGLSDGETIVGTSATLHQPDWARKIVVERAFPALEECGFWEGETAFLNREGVEVPVFQVLMTLPAMPGEPKFIASIVRDITEVKDVERKLLQQTIDLRHSNEELEQVAFVASHDLQEPLRMVCSFLALLELEHNDKLNDEAREYIHYAIDGGLRMRALIDGLLDFSRVGRQNLNLEPIDIRNVVNDALSNLRIAIEDTNAEITCDEFPILMGDKGTLVRVVQNLVGNSLKFRGDGPVNIHIAGQDLGSKVEISVQDNGIGINPRHERKIFLIFQQLHAKSKYPGNGMGLSICKKIIERQGGEIWLDPNSSVGTKICFTLNKEVELS